MKELQKGELLKTVSGKQIEIIEKLGEGGQGSVYRVLFQGKEYALKWYFAEKLKDKLGFYNNIQNNIKQGAPTKAFLWPIEITEFYNDSFGYLMELRPPEYKDFSLFLLAKERFRDIDAVINAALCITNGFRELHVRGFSYQDLNDGNFFVNPKNGQVLICDNDNVAPYGENLGIAGKCRYMAPEVVMGKKQPDIHTDRFSLSVVLFFLLFLNHPLEGKRTMCPCMTEDLEKRFYGSEPIFVWDPNNESNRLVRGIHSNGLKLWPSYPQFIRDEFITAFGHEVLVGKDIEHRIQEKRWQETFMRLRDMTIACSCNEYTFYDSEKENNICMNCKCELPRFNVLNIKKYRVVLAPKQKLYACHIVNDSNDYINEKGEIVQGGSNHDILGIKNNSGNTWLAILPNGLKKEFYDGDVIRIGKGLKIDFGNGNIGEIG